MPSDSNAPDSNFLQVSVSRPNSPDLHHLKSVVLNETERVRKVATYTVPQSRHSGEIHDGNLTLKTYRRKNGEWNEDDKHSVTIAGEEGLSNLSSFLDVCLHGGVPERTGKFVFIPVGSSSQQSATKFAKALTDPSKAEIIAALLEEAAMSPSLMNTLLERARRHPKLFAEATAALNLAEYQSALDELKDLTERDAREAEFQALLDKNPWMFGSEYSEVLKRNWTRGQQVDFAVRRTADGYMEIIEIKTPLDGKDLFQYDKSHDTYYPSVEVSKVIGQVMNYLERFDSERNSIVAYDKEDPFKVRAKVVIGRDGSREQMEALRRYNSHLYGIEIITFDQLVRIAERVVHYLSAALLEEQLPF